MVLVNCQDASVSTSIGTFIGKTKTVDYLGNGKVYQYLGIPYAQPPVGDLRFSKPKPITSYNSSSIFEAQEFGAICPQGPTDVEQSEDCLFLNVFVPAGDAADLAVMVWIHGGGFVGGYSNIYDATVLALYGKVIVVTINYRLGVFGFLSTSDDNARGNFGLWDQREAIRWVHDHIADFGGDIMKVTIAGESAGAMSALQHGFYPQNHGLFQRIIAESGSMSIPAFDVERNGKESAKHIASLLGCPSNQTHELITCMRGKSTDEYYKLAEQGVDFAVFVPIVDWDYIKISPKQIAKSPERELSEDVNFFRSLDVLSGFNAYEGVIYLDMVTGMSVEDAKPTPEQMKTMYLPSLTKLNYHTQYTEELMRLIESEYTNWDAPDNYNSILLQLTKALGDTNFGVPAIEMARLHKTASASRNFMYFFTPEPSVRLLPTPSWIPGANHADEVLFVFGGIGLIGVGDENAWEVVLAFKMMTYWANFVISG